MLQPSNKHTIFQDTYTLQLFNICMYITLQSMYTTCQDAYTFLEFLLQCPLKAARVLQKLFLKTPCCKGCEELHFPK